MRREAPALTLGALGLAALALFVTLRFQVTTDITHFLPDGEPNGDLELARELATGELARTLVLLVEADSTEEAVAAGRALEEGLGEHPDASERIAFLEGGPPEGVEEALWRLYMPRRFAFFARRPEDVAAGTTEASLDAAAARLKERLATPMSGLVGRVAPSDPTLILPDLLTRLVGRQDDGLAVADGRFVSSDGTAAVLFLGTKASATDAAAQRPLLAALDAVFDGRVRDLPGHPRLLLSGAHRFAVRSEGAIREDIRRVSIGATLGLVALLLVVFRSLRLVLLVLPVIAAGFLSGTAACLAVFGSVHGLTLAFGAAMVGVSIDYAVHFQCHHALAPEPGGPRATLQALWSALSLSAGTTAVGFLALCLAAFPGLRELALFGAVGIVAALVATRLFLPGLAGLAATTALARRAVRGLEALLATRSRHLLAMPALLVLALAAFGLPRLAWNDDVADLNRLDPELLAEDAAVRERVVRYEQRRLVVARGADEEAALEVNDRVAGALEAACAAGELGGFRSLATLLPSARRQREVDAAFRAREGLWPNLSTALVAQGFRLEAFEPFRADLEAEAPAPLVYADLLDSPLASLARPFHVSLGDSVGFVTFLNDLRDEAALRARLAALDGAELIDVEAVLGGAYGAYRERMAGLLLLGLFAVVALVAVRYRALRPTLTAVLPALLAAAGTLGLLALLGLPANLLTLVALLLAVGMGVDYGVLLAETGSDPRRRGATYLALLVASASTMLGFGMLALSDQPPLLSIGATAGLGVLLSLVLALSLASLAGPVPKQEDA